MFPPMLPLLCAFTLLLGLCATAPAQIPPQAQTVPANVRQIVVGLADSWNSTRGWILGYERAQANSPWQPAWVAPVPVLFGKNGLAWGRGLLPVPHGAGGIPSKQEKDFRAPAGCFRIGMLFGYASAIPKGAQFPYYQITARDCWIDDIRHPDYNRHVTVNVRNPPPWYEKQKMRLGDFAYEWLLEIRHNSDPPIPGAGSAIFFHIRRGPDHPSAGCTTMAKDQLLNLIRWLRAEKNPHYVLLPRAEYAVRQTAWRLPPPFTVQSAVKKR